MTVTWTIEIHVPAAAADPFEAAVAPFCEVVSGFEMPDEPDTWQILGQCAGGAGPWRADGGVGGGSRRGGRPGA